jgi:hypothetical protein
MPIFTPKESGLRLVPVRRCGALGPRVRQRPLHFARQLRQRKRRKDDAVQQLFTKAEAPRRYSQATQEDYQSRFEGNQES